MEPDQRTYELIGAAMLVHRELGPGYLESIYHAALEIELRQRNVPIRSEVPMQVWFRGQSLGTFRADIEAFGDILLELKALPTFGRAEVSQLAHYLTATGKPLGLLLNFGGDSLQFQRVMPRRSTIAGPRESARLREQAEQHEASRCQADLPGSAESAVALGPPS